jgi:hypothetical protein
MEMTEVAVVRLGLDSTTQSYVLVLQEKGGTRVLPIWIGQAEAESIVMHMHDVKPPRPITHDLCARLITQLGGTLQQIQITRVENNTYYAELHIARGSEIVRIDARPSDSVAVALRLAVPIFAASALLSEIEIEEASPEETAVHESEAIAGEIALSAEQLKEYLEHLRPEDFGKFHL